MKCASFFAGVGGIDIGFKNEGFDIVYANEFDDYAIQTYELNSELKVDARDIRTVNADEIPDFDVMFAGFPCQAFSIAGLQQGFNDKKGRGDLFFELLRILKVKKPKVAFFENVKNLVNHDKGRTFKVLIDELNNAGYSLKYAVLNACDYANIPQNRERVYIVAFLNQEQCSRFEFPKQIELKKKLDDIIEFSKVVDSKYYYSNNNCKFYDKLLSQMHSGNKKTVYQWRRVYLRENQSSLVPTLTANMGEGGHNVPLIVTADGRIRKLTPRECFNAQGFPAVFKLPVNQANSKLYKQAGNSVVVPMIARIAKCIKVATD